MWRVEIRVASLRTLCKLWLSIIAAVASALALTALALFALTALALFTLTALALFALTALALFALALVAAALLALTVALVAASAGRAAFGISGLLDGIVGSVRTWRPVAVGCWFVICLAVCRHIIFDIVTYIFARNVIG